MNNPLSSKHPVRTGVWTPKHLLRRLVIMDSKQLLTRYLEDFGCLSLRTEMFRETITAGLWESWWAFMIGLITVFPTRRQWYNKVRVEHQLDNAKFLELICYYCYNLDSEVFCAWREFSWVGWFWRFFCWNRKWGKMNRPIPFEISSCSSSMWKKSALSIREYPRKSCVATNSCSWILSIPKYKITHWLATN